MSVTYVLGEDRTRVHHGVKNAPKGHVCEIREPRRTLPQNDKMHAMLTDVARSKWRECGYDKDDWKVIFMRALKKEEPRHLKDLDGQMFPVGYKTSQLTKSQMADLISLIQAWGDENGVDWSDQESEQEAA